MGTVRLPGALREERAFRLLFAGQALSVVGDRVQPVALAFAVLALGSATDLGVILAAGALPFALFAIAGGVVADRAGRREVMVVSDAIRAAVQAVTAALILSGAAEVWMLVCLSAIYGTAAAVFGPAMVGLIPQTTSAARLQEANALLALTRSVGNVAGPAIAGVVIALSGPGEAIALDALTFVVSAVLLLRVVPRELPARAYGAAQRFAEQLRDGWREVRSRAWLRRGLVAMSAYHVFVLPAVFVLGPALAERELNGASSWATISAAFGLGTLAGNLVALRVPVRRPILVAAAALVAASLQAAIIGSGLGTAGIAAFEALAGVAVALFFTFWDLSIQEQVPPGAVARVSSYDFAVSTGLMPLGLAVAGPVADAAGLQATLLAMSALGLLSALGWLATPAVRTLRRPERAEPPAPAAPPTEALVP
ncbi:MAG TPA: MFS transporter [Solirubrobacteraceae bacterium]|nr:MFS transporter [Solirubrobacteraceae bacterium]